MTTQDTSIEIQIKRPRTEVCSTPVLIEYVNQNDFVEKEKANRKNDATIQCRICFDKRVLTMFNAACISSKIRTDN